jgi:hypothetical protein
MWTRDKEMEPLYDANIRLVMPSMITPAKVNRELFQQKIDDNFHSSLPLPERYTSGYICKNDGGVAMGLRRVLGGIR